MNIEDYELEEDTYCIIFEHKNTIAIDTGCDLVELTRKDITAFAEHFNITKQIELALLNSLIADFVKGSIPFEDVVASRLNSLELEK